MFEQHLVMSRSRHEKWSLSLGIVDRRSANKCAEGKNLLAHRHGRGEDQIREDAPTLNSYSRRKRFSDPAGWSHRLQFQRQRRQCAVHSRYVCPQRRHDHTAVRPIHVVNAGDNLKKNQIARRRLRSDHRRYEIFRHHRDGSKDVYHDSRRATNHSWASLTHRKDAQLSWLTDSERSRLLDVGDCNKLFGNYVGNERHRQRRKRRA